MDIASITSLSGTPAAALAALTPAGGASPAAAGSTAAQRKKAAAQFEAIMVRQLLSKSVGSMLGGSGHTTGLIYGDMMTDVLAQKLTEGQGLGLGRMIEQQISPPTSHAAPAPTTH
jgi:Rod binding domain-containing protein